MSTTFNVFPLKKEFPTFQQVVELSTEKLNRFLKDYKINFNAKIEVKLLSKENDVEKSIDLNSPAKWNDELYAWFTIFSINGGSDSYYWELNNEDRDDNLEELLSGELTTSRKDLITNCLENKVQWHFRRSAGQSGITTIAYGFIASTFAELTNGIIFSGDSAWDYQIFPATAVEFDEVYFRPEKAVSEDNRKWAKSCIESII